MHDCGNDNLIRASEPDESKSISIQVVASSLYGPGGDGICPELRLKIRRAALSCGSELPVHQTRRPPMIHDPPSFSKRCTPLDVEIGQRLRELRREKQMTQRDIAKALGVTYQQVQKYEAGINRIPASRLLRICRALDVDISHLLGPDDIFQDSNN